MEQVLVHSSQSVILCHSAAIGRTTLSPWDPSPGSSPNHRIESVNVLLDDEGPACSAQHPLPMHIPILCVLDVGFRSVSWSTRERRIVWLLSIHMLRGQHSRRRDREPVWRLSTTWPDVDGLLLRVPKVRINPEQDKAPTGNVTACFVRDEVGISFSFGPFRVGFEDPREQGVAVFSVTTPTHPDQSTRHGQIIWLSNYPDSWLEAIQA